MSSALLLCLLGVAMSAAGSQPLVLVPADFQPRVLDLADGPQFDLVPPGDLERTPRDYLAVKVTVKATGIGRAALAVTDILDHEYRTETVRLPRGRDCELSCDMATAGRPLSLLRAVRIITTGQPIELKAVQFLCRSELLPEPDVVVSGPRDGTSIQAALNALPQSGGVVYIPAGTYTINEPITIPVPDVTIYGDGALTVLQGTWFDPPPLLQATGKHDIRLTRLHLRSLPIDEFRGYHQKQYAEKPEDIGRPSVYSTGITLSDCQNCRIDHCEIELFGHTGIYIRGGSKNTCVDHCFLHENFKYGEGYGVVPEGTRDCYIEDNNFENHRHGVAGSNNSMCQYTCRFNRFVKDPTTLPAEGWKQVSAHEIDVHGGNSWVFAHDNWVEMKNGMMGAGACLRGNPGWIYRNHFVNCDLGIYVCGNSDDVWTWQNSFTNVSTAHLTKATGTVHFDETPADFKEIPYPCQLNRPGWWPGARAEATIARPTTQFAGPYGHQVLVLTGAAP